jgi:lipopolysaccharide transport system ATP-binding protein
MSTVITVENLGKKYTLHHQQREQYTALRDVLTNGVASFGKKLLNPFRRNFNLQPSTLNLPSEDFWALKAVSFEVKQGDRIGIIGRNGAGKSTLLKILSRITEPTTGSVRIKGRVASLLEVGTGFHPELTGRENIFLNGAILGMGRAEIKKKFDEIVDFAEIEKFLDTPVKRYSSGMYVRLAFAVAAHLEPEILIVDEVLAVGDAQFQKKCLGKMQDVSAREGRTVLFVSHNMGAVSALTKRAIVLDAGRVNFIGHSDDAVMKYLASSYNNNVVWVAAEPSIKTIQFLRGEISSGGLVSNELDVLKNIDITIQYEVRKPVKGAVVAVIVHASDGALLFSTEDTDCRTELLEKRESGNFKSTITIPGGWLNKGEYHVRLSSGIPGSEIFDNVEALNFTLVDTGNHLTRGHRSSAYLLPSIMWTLDHV